MARFFHPLLSLLANATESHLAQYVEHYNKERPHPNKGNLPLGIEKAPDVGNELGQVICEERLGGLLRHYERKAAWGRRSRLAPPGPHTTLGEPPPCIA